MNCGVSGGAGNGEAAGGGAGAGEAVWRDSGAEAAKMFDLAFDESGGIKQIDEEYK